MLSLPPGSLQLEALLAAPGKWTPSDDGDGVELTRSWIELDEDGWIRESRLGWRDDQGWRLHLSFEGDSAQAPPTRIQLQFQPPPDSGQPAWPMGEGSVRYDGPERVLKYEGRRPGVEGVERFEQRVRLDSSGRLEREDSTTTTTTDGVSVHRRVQVLGRDAQGRANLGLELIDGQEYRVSSLHFRPDGQGNSRRQVRLFRAADAASDAPVQRAEVILRTYRYQDETR